MKINNRSYKICSKTIMDTSDPDIHFDENGVSNHWFRHHDKEKKLLLPPAERQIALDQLVTKMRRHGKGKKYDCIIGVSGGVDSTYVAYLVKKLGLRPLAVHLDNGWNSELAVHNIEKVLNKLEIDLYTYVIDWEEFRDIQLSFLRASTPDGEIPTDHAIISLLYKTAAENGLKYILNGVNVMSESILPLKWGYGYYDLKYIRDVQKQFGTKKIKSLPTLSISRLIYYSLVKKIQFLPILNYVDYKKEETMKVLENDLGWIYYGGKHYESIYTRFFQSYILPEKFGIDKRRAHYSNLICSGQLSREEALEMIKNPACNPEMMQQDKEYVIKKLNISADEFEEIMSLPPKTFLDYKNHYAFFEQLKKIKASLKL